jgi:uncharacterized protein
MRFITKISVLILFPVFIHAQKRESVLWEISGNALEKKSFLFGTIHIASDEIPREFPGLQKIIQQCDYGLFEFTKDGTGSDREWSEDLILQEPPLDSIFTPQEYRLVDSFFTNSPFGSIRSHNNDASLFAMAQTAMLLKCSEGKQQILFDDYLEDFMDSLKKPLFQLDNYGDRTIQKAQSYFRELAMTIVDILSPDNKYKLLENGDLEVSPYEKSLTSNLQLNKEAEGQIKMVTVERNLVWLPKMISKMKNGSCFIAVGRGHLQYKTGLIQLLRKEGYTLKPVKIKRQS